MRWQATALALLALPALAGCPAREPDRTEIEVWVTVVKDAQGNEKVVVDASEERHDSAVVEPGDRVTWVCREGSAAEGEEKPCSDELEFAVDNLHYVGDLAQLVQIMRQPATLDPQALEELAQDVQALQEEAAAMAPEERQQRAETLMSGRVRFEGPIGDMIRIVRVEDGPGERPAVPTLFEEAPVDSVNFLDDPKPLKFTGGSEKIQSPPVARDVGESVWKFTWRVRLKGKPESEGILDPHIFTHVYISG